MKKIFVLIFCLFMVTNITFAANIKDSYINFHGNKYCLLYSTKNKNSGGYINEYYKLGETYHMWSEMIAVHHFPNSYSPISQVKDFREYLASINCPSSLTFDDKKNSAMIDFIMINNSRLPVIMEFNVFKYQKSRKCGSVAIQYAKRYAVKTEFEADDAKKDFEKKRKKTINAVKHFEIPRLVYEEIDKCKLADDSIKKNDSGAEISGNEDTAETINPEIVKSLSSILTQEEFTTYKEPLFFNNDIEDELSNDTEDIPLEKDEQNIIYTKYKDYNDILNQELIINYDKSAKYIPEKSSEKTLQLQDKPMQQSGSDIEIKSTNSKSDKKYNKKTKQKTYKIENSKSDFYAKPLTKKEIKARNKRLKKELSQKALKKRVKQANEKLKN